MAVHTSYHPGELATPIKGCTRGLDKGVSLINTRIKHPLHPFLTYKVLINILEVEG